MKKNILSFAVVSVFMAVITAVGLLFSSGAVLMGDVNRDGKVNSQDGRAVLRFSAKLELFDDQALRLADVNFDNKVNSSDARSILRMAAKLDPTFTAVQPEHTSSEGTTFAPETEITVVTEDKTTTKPNAPVTQLPVESTTSEEATTASVPLETEVTTEPVTEPELPVQSVEHADYYVKTAVYHYEGKKVKTEKAELAVQTVQTKVGADVVTSHHYYQRSDSLFPGRDMGLLVREYVDGNGDIFQNVFLIDYDAKEYLGMNSHFIKKYLPSFALPTVPDRPMITYSSLDGLRTEHIEENGIGYEKYRKIAEDGTYFDCYLIGSADQTCYRPAIVKYYDAEGVLSSELHIEAFTTDPTAYVAISGISGVTLTTENFSDYIDRFRNFMNRMDMNV